MEACQPTGIRRPNADYVAKPLDNDLLKIQSAFSVGNKTSDNRKIIPPDVLRKFLDSEKLAVFAAPEIETQPTIATKRFEDPLSIRSNNQIAEENCETAEVLAITNQAFNSATNDFDRIGLLRQVRSHVCKL